MTPRTLAPLAFSLSRSVALVALAGCASDIGTGTQVQAPPDGAVGEGEGEPGEGEGEPGEGEGEGQAGEGEGEPGEGEGEPGEGEGETGESVGEDGCSVTACASAPTSAVSFTFGALPSASTGGATVTVGSSTRGSVEGQLGIGQSVDELGFRVRYCAAGIEVQYVDSDGTFDGASTGNAVARIVTLAGASASGGGYAIGAAAPGVGAEQVFGTSAGAVRFDATRGLEAIVDEAGVVRGLVAFRAQDAGRNWGVAFEVSDDESSLGGVRAGGQDLGSGDSFNDLEAVIGSDFDADGTVEVDVGAFNVEVHVRVYAALGIRVAGVCGLNGCDDNDEIGSITLSPPYAGAWNGVRLSDARTDVEAALAAGAGVGPDDNGIVAYGGFSSDFGVGYAQEGPCANRAGMFVLGYDPP